VSNILKFDEDLYLTDGTYRIVGAVGGLLRLQNQGTGQQSTAQIAELLPRLVDPPVWAQTDPQELTTLPAGERKEVEEWAAHLEEMTTGIRPGHETPRPQYDPATTSLNQRTQSKVEELTLRGWPASRASLLRKKTLWERGGAAALIDRRKSRKFGKLDRADAEVVDAIIAVAQREVRRSTKTQRHLHDLVEAELTLKYADSDAVAPALPSRATMYRHFNALTEGKHATGKATTRRSLANRPNRTYGSRRTLLPGEEVQVDSTKLDLMVRVQGLKKPVRPVLTVLQDAATRTIIATTIRIDAAKGYDHALLLGQALVPFELRPDRSAHRALVSARRPEFPLLSAEDRRALERTRPFIFPRRIMTDNGKDFLSTVFTSAARKFQIDITNSATRTPTDKGMVERNFGAVVSLFVQSLPGYTGNHPVNRGEDVEGEDLLDLATLSELLDDWVLSVWQNRKHEGLRDPFEPSITYSPNQAYDAAMAFSGATHLPASTNDFIDLLPTTHRVLGTVGIEFNNRHYDSDELRLYRGTRSRDQKHNYQWEVKYNPYDALHVWVRSPEGNWIECTWRHAAALTQPHFGDISRELKGEDKDTTVRNEIAREHAARNGVPMPTGAPEADALQGTIDDVLLDAFTTFEPFNYDEV
jgi:putative transposase